MLTCRLTGFLMYFIGCMHIFLMTAISFERYYIIQKPMHMKKFKSKLMIQIVVGCVLMSFFWSAMPLFGAWSHYSLEEGRVGCCVEYREKSLNVISYNVAMFVFVFTIPFGFILVSNLRMLLIVLTD